MYVLWTFHLNALKINENENERTFEWCTTQCKKVKRKQRGGIIGAGDFSVFGIDLKIDRVKKKRKGKETKNKIILSSRGNHSFPNGT